MRFWLRWDRSGDATRALQRRWIRLISADPSRACLALGSGICLAAPRSVAEGCPIGPASHHRSDPCSRCQLAWPLSRWACKPIAQMKPASSLATATHALLTCTPRPRSAANRCVSRNCAFQAIVRMDSDALPGGPALLGWFEPWSDSSRPLRSRAGGVRVSRLGDAAAADSFATRALRGD